MPVEVTKEADKIYDNRFAENFRQPYFMDLADSLPSISLQIPP
jgi:hypothetical protein